MLKTFAETIDFTKAKMYNHIKQVQMNTRGAIMNYVTLFEIDGFSFSFVYLIMAVACVLMLSFVIHAFRNKKPIAEKVLSIIVLAAFSVTTVYTVISNNKAQTEMYKMLKNGEFSVVEGEIEAFSTPTVLGHETEHFNVNGVHFEYSNEIDGMEPKVLGGCIKGDGQKVRISYITVDERNLILRVEELVEVQN